MLYTSYYSKLALLPNDVPKLIISRFPPKWIDRTKYSKLYLWKSLAPSAQLLEFYKDPCSMVYQNWDWYRKTFYWELKNNKNMKSHLEKLYKHLKIHEDVILLCFEKDYKHCHRYLIAKYFEQRNIKYGGEYKC